MVNKLIKNPMRIRNLEIYNVPSYILDIWEKNYSPCLLPVQKKAVKDYDILNFNNSNKAKPNSTTYSTTLTMPNNNNHNLLVIAPPSSGKTLIGEMAAITYTLHKQKAIYLVPFPFMADNKYNHFTDLYTSCGLDIVISSRTRKEDDQKIIKGDYDLAVIVYEKFNHFLLTYPDFQKKLSLLIIDKMQMINDYRKGPLLKSIIDIIRNRKPDLKIIALSALMENFLSVKKILSAQLLISFQRPVELRKGIVREGVFNYIEHNTKKIGKETFFKAKAVRDNCFEDYLKETVNYFIQKNESTLIFFPTCQEAQKWAFYLSSHIDGPKADQAIDEFHYIEDTFSREKLLTLLERGITYYNNELAWEERDLIETYVKKGEIKVVCATTTLSMEINPTFKNVILASEELCIEKEYSQHNYQECLSPIDIENIGGKAGILNKSLKDKTWRQSGKKEKFGRLIFLAHNMFQETKLKNLYFNLIADYYLQEDERFAKYYLMGKSAINNYIETNTSEDNWLLQKFDFGENDINNLENKMEINLKKLLDYGLITQDKEGQSLLTPEGTLVITKNIKVETYLGFKTWLDANKEEEISNLEIIQILTSSSDGKRFSIPNLQISDREKTLLLYDWIENREIKSIQQEYGLQANSIQRLGKSFSWLADSLAAVAESIGWAKDNPKGLEKIKIISERLEIGVEEEGLELAQLYIRGLNRNYIRILVKEGYTNEECLRQLTEEKLKHLLPEKLIKRIKQKLDPFSNLSPTKNNKPKPKTRNLQPILQIDRHRPDRVIFQGQEIKVTAKGFSLLYLLAQHRKKVVSYDNILDEIWKKDDEEAIYTRIIQHIYKFRRDILEVIGNNKTNKEKVKDIFKVVSGRGVMLNINDKELKIN